MKLRVIFLFVFVVACALFAAADISVVDLSGHWVLDLRNSRGRPDSPPRSSIAIDPGIGWPPGVGPTGAPTRGPVGIILLREGGPDLSLQIVQTANEIQITRKFTVVRTQQTVKQLFDLNGSQNHNPSADGHGDFVSISTWENGEIVNWGTITKGQSSITLKEEYRISKDRKKLTIIRSGFFGMPPSSPKRDFQKPDVTDTVVFRRK